MSDSKEQQWGSVADWHFSPSPWAREYTAVSDTQRPSAFERQYADSLAPSALGYAAPELEGLRARLRDLDEALAALHVTIMALRERAGEQSNEGERAIARGTTYPPLLRHPLQS